MRTTSEERAGWRTGAPMKEGGWSRLFDDAETADVLTDAVANIALAAGLPATATPAEVVARVERLRGYVNDMAEHDCAYGDGCVSTARHGRCVGCSARRASEAGP